MPESKISYGPKIKSSIFTAHKKRLMTIYFSILYHLFPLDIEKKIVINMKVKKNIYFHCNHEFDNNLNKILSKF